MQTFNNRITAKVDFGLISMENCFNEYYKCYNIISITILFKACIEYTLF